VLPQSLAISLGELAGAVKEGLLAFSVGVGLAVLHLLMEEDVVVLAGAKGVTGGLVSKWERGICRPNRSHRRLLCQFFSATLDDLGFRARVQPSSLGVSEEALVDDVALRGSRQWGRCIG